MIMKKIYCILLSVLIAGICGIDSAYAADLSNTEAILYSEQVTSSAGEEFVLPICISNNPGIACIRLDIKYDTEIFSIVKNSEDADGAILVEKGEAVSAGNMMVKETEEGCQLSWWNDSNTIQDGTLFLIHMKTSDDAKDGNYQVDLSYYPQDTGNEKEQLVGFICKKSNIKIESNESTVYAGNIKIKAGQTVDYPVYIKNNPGISAIMVYIRFSAEETVQVVTDGDGGIVVQNGDFTSKGSTIANTYLSGWRVLWYTTEGDQFQDGSLFKLKLKTSENVSEGDIPVYVTCMPDNTTDADGNKVSILNTQNGSLKVRATRYGDIDDSMNVDFADAIWLKRSIAGWSEFQNIDVSIADLNADGKITIEDLTLLERHIAGWKGYEQLEYGMEIPE